MYVDHDLKDLFLSGSRFQNSCRFDEGKTDTFLIFDSGANIS